MLQAWVHRSCGHQDLGGVLVQLLNRLLSSLCVSCYYFCLRWRRYCTGFADRRNAFAFQFIRFVSISGVTDAKSNRFPCSNVHGRAVDSPQSERFTASVPTVPEDTLHAHHFMPPLRTWYLGLGSSPSCRVHRPRWTRSMCFSRLLRS